jgi:crossover junction endodeoxyribonuclease RusA
LIQLRLPYPPSINAYWLASGHRRYISKRGIKFKQAVADYVLEWRIPKLGSQPLEIEIWLHPRSKQLMDIDNCVKPILDACQDAGIFDDDVQVQQLFVKRSKAKKGGGCTVWIDVLSTSPDVCSDELS